MTAPAAAEGSLDALDLFRRINYEPHRGQLRVHASPARNRVVAAGRRFGKSKIGGSELYPECLLTYARRSELRGMGVRREFWIVGPEYSDSEKEFRVLWDALVKRDVPMDKPGSYNDPIGGSLHISAFEGLFQVHGKSAKHPETLVGEGLSGVILAEAAKLKERVWTKFIRPTLADFAGWALFSSTPEGKNWFYKLYQNGQDPFMTDWWSVRMPSWRNNHVYRQATNDRDVKRAQALLMRRSADDLRELRQLIIDPEIMAMLLDLTPETFNQEIGADFTEFVGRVFKDFDEEVHVGDFEFERSWDTYAAVDYGFTNPFVWLLIQVGPWGDIRIVDELYQRGMTPQESIAEIKRRGLCPDNLICFYPDPASPGESTELSEGLKKPWRGGTGGELKDRLDAIRKALKFRNPDLPSDHPEAIPGIMINRRCTETIRDFLEYRYPKSAEEAAMLDQNAPEQPLKKDDHAPEALGRFFAGHFAPRTATKPRGTRVRSSTMG